LRDLSGDTNEVASAPEAAITHRNSQRSLRPAAGRSGSEFRHSRCNTAQFASPVAIGSIPYGPDPAESIVPYDRFIGPREPGQGLADRIGHRRLACVLNRAGRCRQHGANGCFGVRKC
jgi:hypothetical protein